MKLASTVLTISALAAAGSLAFQSASYAQSAAALATVISSDAISASGITGTLNPAAAIAPASADASFQGGTTAGSAGTRSTFCLSDVNLNATTE